MGGRRTVLLASVAAAVSVSGIQAIAPALPAIQDALGLSDFKVSLINGLYLLPSVFVAIPAGLLADRIGTRRVLSVSLVLFGISGLLLVLTQSLWAMFASRVLQGAAYGVIAPVTITVIARIATTGAAAAKAQGRRVVAMAAGDAVFPALGGALVAVSWFAPFAMHAAALPLAVAVWHWIPDGPPAAPASTGSRPSARSALRAPAIVGVQVLAALRFFFKFAVVTYYPVFAVNDLGMSVVVVGITLGASSLTAVLSATSTHRLARRFSSPRLLALSLMGVVLSLGALHATNSTALAVVAIIVFGMQDGVYGVAHNVLVTEMAPQEVLSTYVGITGTTRNVGKLVAPLLFGVGTLIMSVGQVFLAMAALAAVFLPVTRWVGRVRAGLRIDHGGP